MIGACLISAAARDVMQRVLVPSDFYTPARARFAEAILDLHRVGAGVDAVTVAGWVSDRYGARVLEDAGGLTALVDMQAECPSSSSAPTYAVRVRDRASRRKMRALLMEKNRLVDDLAVPVEEVADELRAELADVDIPVGGEEPPANIEEFLAADFQYRWLVPNLLERGDRMILTATEGAGKSTMLRQLAVQLAAGVHPFANLRFPPVRTLIVDLENSDPQVQRQMQRLWKLVRNDPAQQPMDGPAPEWFDPDRVRIAVRQQGIDLLSRADRRWLTGLVEASRPDVILSGPIYKMHRGDPIDEKPAAEMAAYFDELRTRYDCALILEAHAPLGNDGGKHRTLRPYGASLWMRWPEFGFGIRPNPNGYEFDWVAWRGARDDERLWPMKIRRGRTWPWVNSIAYDEPARPEEPPF